MSPGEDKRDEHPEQPVGNSEQVGGCFAFTSKHLQAPYTNEPESHPRNVAWLRSCCSYMLQRYLRALMRRRPLVRAFRFCGCRGLAWTWDSRHKGPAAAATDETPAEAW